MGGIRGQSGSSDDGPTDSRTAGQKRADALVLICGFFLDHHTTRPTSGGQRPHVAVTVDLQVLARTAPGSHHGPTGPWWARRRHRPATVLRPSRHPGDHQRPIRNPRRRTKNQGDTHRVTYRRGATRPVLSGTRMRHTTLVLGSAPHHPLGQRRVSPPEPTAACSAANTTK